MQKACRGHRSRENGATSEPPTLAAAAIDRSRLGQRSTWTQQGRKDRLHRCRPRFRRRCHLLRGLLCLLRWLRHGNDL